MTIEDVAKVAGDLVNVIVVLGTLTQILPAIATLLAFIWTGIRIYESATVQRWLNRPPS